MKKISIVTAMLCAMILAVQPITDTNIVSAQESSTTAAKTNATTFPASIKEVFPDENLAAVVADVLNKSVEEQVTEGELAEIKELDASYCEISSLEGIQYLTGLEWLSLYNNNISDISQLTNLTSLKWLHLGANDISDIGPLKDLKNLYYLSLAGNNVEDLDPIKGLTNLTHLNLGENEITDISPLTNLKSLSELYLYSNEIVDISPLSSLAELTILDLSGNHVKDVAALSGSTNLTELKLQNNEITDISSLSGLTSLTTLDVTNQFISLSETNVGTKTTVPIKNVDGTTPFVKFVLGTGEYKKDELSWSTAGDNKATWTITNANGEFSGTIYQSVDAGGILTPATGDDTQMMLLLSLALAAAVGITVMIKKSRTAE